MKITIGADPEVFAGVLLRSGKIGFRSAHGMIPGTKKEPFKVDKGAVQVDGMALEFNIDPAHTVEEFVANISAVRKELRRLVPEKYKLVIAPSVEFSYPHFKKQPEEAKELGCDPDFNAYTLKTNKAPNGATRLRTAAGHIHIGFCEGADIKDPEHIQRCATLIKQLDCFVGIPLAYMEPEGAVRRSLYGKAGAFRPKPYGVEYRTPSNFWLRTVDLQKYVYTQTQRAVSNLLEGNRPFTEIGDNKVQSAVNIHVYTRTMDTLKACGAVPDWDIFRDLRQEAVKGGCHVS